MKRWLYFILLLIALLASLVFGVPPAAQPAKVNAAATAALYPATVVSTPVGLYVNAPWINPTNVGADDTTYADIGTKVLDSGGYTERLDATNFGFAIPTGSTIDGIVVEIEQRSDVASVTDELIQLIQGGTPAGTDYGIGASLPQTDTIATFGSSSDLWGLTWTAADINASNFGVAVVGTSSANNVEYYIDFIRITVYYTPPPPDIFNTPTSFDFGTLAESGTYETTGGLITAYFTVTNNSAYAINITISGTDMTGGTTWTLSDTATPGANTYGLKAGLEGGSYSVIVPKTGSNTLISGLAASGTQDWALQLLAPTTFADGTSKSGTVTLTATAA